MNSKNVLSVKNLNKFYKKKGSKSIQALKNLNLEVKEGEILGLLGPNGAGKSTFINILGGSVLKTDGNINVWGFNIDKNPRQVRASIGIVPQEVNFDPFFSPRNLLELQAGLYGIKKNDRKTLEIINNMGLSDQKDSYARTLSGGMRRRLLIGKALVHDPEMLILDEPTAGVDINLRTSLWEYIKKINKLGTTVCLTTHYLEEAEQLCEFITILNDGEIIANDTKNNLLDTISTKKVSFFLENNSEIPKILLKFKCSINNKILTIFYDKKEINLNKIITILNAENIKFTEINTYESKLEDTFIKLTKLRKNNV